MSFGEYLGAGSGVTNVLYHLNGDGNDSSGNGLNLLSYNTVSFSKSYGKFNEGVGNFFATSSCLYSNDNAKFDLTTFTISLFFQVTGVWDGCIISKFKGAQNSSTNYYVDTAGGSNRLRVFFAANGTFYNTTINKSLNSNQWYNLIITAGIGVVKVYIDATLINTINYTGTITTNDFPFVIGARWSSLNTFESFLAGNVDEVIIENVVWDAVKIQKYYSQTLGRFATI